MINELIPHSDEMLFIEKINSINVTGSSYLEMTLKEDSFYFENKQFQVEWCIEFMAQAAGSVFSFTYTESKNKLSLGFLLSIDYFKILNDCIKYFKAGDLLIFEVKLMYDFSEIRKYYCKVIYNNIDYAVAEMKFIAKTKSDAEIKNEKSIFNWW